MQLNQVYTRGRLVIADGGIDAMVPLDAAVAPHRIIMSQGWVACGQILSDWTMLPVRGLLFRGYRIWTPWWRMKAIGRWYAENPSALEEIPLLDELIASIAELGLEQVTDITLRGAHMLIRIWPGSFGSTGSLSNTVDELSAILSRPPQGA